jgi:hypothetical protein
MNSQPMASSSAKVKAKPRRAIWRGRISVFAFGVVFVLLVTLALAVRWPLTGRFDLTAGDVAPNDILAPRYIAFISDSLTEEARQLAERRVADVFEPQRRMRTDQVRRAQQVQAIVDAVRIDAESNSEEKLQALQAIPDVQLAAADWERLLALDDDSWVRVQQEVPDVLNTIMLSEIRESQLPSVQRRVPSFIDLEEEEEAQAAIVLVQALLRPNSLINTERTNALRQEARNEVLPQTVSYEESEIIVRQGDIVTQQHVEALDALGLNQPSWDWWQLLQASLLAALFACVFGLYLWRFAPALLAQPQRLSLLVALLGAFLLLGALMLPNHTLLPYVFPLAALTMLITPLLGVAVALLVLTCFAVVVAYLTEGSVSVIAYTVIGSLIGALVLGRADRISGFVKAGGAVILANIATVTAFSLPLGGQDLTGYLQLLAAGAVNGSLAASITLIGFYLLGAIFDIATPLRLMELSRPNHPLLSDLMMKAPGTYHHSLLVSNLSEQAAQAIGADAFLTRVGAYYHDVGKIARPYFFVENRLEGASPHNQLDPWSSAQIIINHVRDGLELARRHKLPGRLRDFIAEHQGTGLVRYFYHEAQKMAGDEPVDENDFRYPGPRPQSKETAILMLADSCESAVRAEHPDSREAVEEVVSKIMNQRLIEGELGESDLTLRDLEIIRQIFVRSLQGVHHPRIKYPEIKVSPQIISNDAPATTSSVAP